MRKINAEGEAVACYVSLETGQDISDEEKAIPGFCSAIRSFARDFLGPELPVSTEPAATSSSFPVNPVYPVILSDFLEIRRWLVPLSVRPYS